MKPFLRTGFYLFHPLWIPFLGTLLFFAMIPREFPSTLIEKKLVGIIILSILAPVVFLLALRKRNNYHLFEWKNSQVRRFYLLFLCLILITINNFLIPVELIELSYFFAGLLIVSSMALFLTYIHFTISIHVAFLSCLLSFICCLSFLYQLNLLYLISPLIFIIGWVSSERMSGPCSHKGIEILYSLFLGLLPQGILVFGIYQHYKM